MSRRGNGWDTAVAESVFATLTIELGHDDRPWLTRAHAQGEVFEYIEGFYTGQRRHSTLGYLSPLTFERQWAATAAVASRPIEGLPLQHASPVEAPGSTRMRGAALSVSPQRTVVAPITGLAGILEVASLIPSEPQCSAP
jgi:putative transposase